MLRQQDTDDRMRLAGGHGFHGDAQHPHVRKSGTEYTKQGTVTGSCCASGEIRLKARVS